MICAHRGYSAAYPDNTLIAFEKAAELGVDMVELDISMSKDGIPMLFHDARLETHSAPLTGMVRDYTRDELRQVRIGAKMGMPDQELCTFEDFCRLYTRYPGIIVDVDLKPYCGVQETIQPVMEIIRKYGFEERVIFNSIDGEITRYLHENTDCVIVGPPEGWPHGVNQVPGLDGTYATLDAVCVPTKDLTQEGCDYLKSIGKIVISAPVADEEGASLCLKYGVQIPLSDNPVHLLRMTGRLK